MLVDMMLVDMMLVGGCLPPPAFSNDDNWCFLPFLPLGNPQKISIVLCCIIFFVNYVLML